MKTKTIRDSAGHPFAFEIKNNVLSLQAVKRILSTIDGVSDIRTNRLCSLFDFRSEEKVGFHFLGTEYVVTEAYSRNCDFWIGPKDLLKKDPRIERIEKAFIAYKPPVFIKGVAGLFSVNLKEFFRAE